MHIILLLLAVSRVDGAQDQIHSVERSLGAQFGAPGGTLILVDPSKAIKPANTIIIEALFLCRFDDARGRLQHPCFTQLMSDVEDGNCRFIRVAFVQVMTEFITIITPETCPLGFPRILS